MAKSAALWLLKISNSSISELDFDAGVNPRDAFVKMATVLGQLILEIVKKNNSFLVKEFGNGAAGVVFSKEPNNLHSYKHFGFIFLSMKMIDNGNNRLCNNHAVIILTGIFVEPKLSRIFYVVENWQHYVGFAYGIQSGRFGAGLKQLGIQNLGLVFVICLNVVMTTLICLLIKVVVPLRLDEEALHMGDDSVHGEEAYPLYGEGKRRENFKENTVYRFA
ncbi:unnamed protein product [Fraxinus pennsylvanica]|uniref:Ammonium transporter AmtB-like domain-containing protein n=1 Tax=Fraxinus pennsylvanica TaxID=56036 RepID=A0AAD1ZGD2_9LAMI|nr:unnamed protein product [Fraxinus pennsylvanica]